MEPPKRGFAMVPNQLTFDMTISPVSKNLYAALLYLAKGSRLVNGQKAAEIADRIELKPSTFRKCLKQLEDGNYIARKNKQSRWFEIEFVPESDRILATVIASKEAGYSPRNEQVEPDTRYVGSKYSLRTEQAVATDVASKAKPHPISVFDKGIDKERLSTVSPIKKAGEGVMESDADRISSWVYERILKAFPGDECLAESASIQAAGWVRDEGHSPDDIKATLVEVIGKGIRPIGLMNYTHKVIGSNQARAKAEAASPPPIAVASGPSPAFQHRTKAQRDAEVSEKRRAAIMQMFPVPPKEDHLEG